MSKKKISMSLKFKNLIKNKLKKKKHNKKALKYADLSGFEFLLKK
jgi:hypothetical protein